MQTFLKTELRWTLLATVCTLAACQTPPPPTPPARIAEDSAAAVAKGCKPVTKSNSQIPILAFPTGSGKQCLVQDLVQRNVTALDNGENVGSPSHNGVTGIVSFFRANNLDMDLQGHLVTGKPFKNTVGVQADTPSQRGGEEKSGPNLRVHNGTIQTPGPFSTGVFMGDLKIGELINGRTVEDRVAQDGSGQYDGDLEPLSDNRVWNPATKATYYTRGTYTIPTHFTAEDLHIESGGRGIVMVGTDNVIRNNVIEVDGKVAVYSYGPRPIIEGNTFIVYLDPRDTATLPAMLKLRDADGAIIRNNRFIVKRGRFTGLSPDKAEAAINLLTSKDVLIENNTVEDTRQLVRKDDASSLVERGNTLK